MSTIALKSAAQTLAEAAVERLRLNLGPFVVAAETTRMAMVFTDATIAGHPIVFANNAFQKLAGYAREEILGQPFNFLMARGDNEHALAQVQAAFAGESEGHLEMRDRRKDGTLFWAAVFTHPVRDAAGKIVNHFASFVDLTDHKREAEHLRFLLDELNHRTQNTLVTVQAIALQTLRGVADKAAVETFEGRLLALSKAHALLGRHNWDAVTLRDVLDRILEPFGLSDAPLSRVSLKGGRIPLTPKAALTLAMVFHELATNAAKHGALAKDKGHIDIVWRTEETPGGERLFLRWEEAGGPPIMPPDAKGFGSRLIEGGLARELNGDVHIAYEPSGLICRIAMPLSPPTPR